MSSGYFGYGTRRDYVRFFLRRGLAVSEIAEALNTTIAQLVFEFPDLDLCSKKLFPGEIGFTGDEVRLLLKYYPDHGAVWDGWRVYLPRHKKGSITSMANRLGASRHFGNATRKR